MPRINVDDLWFDDPRRSKLIKLAGGEELADGIALKFWKLSQNYFRQGALIPKKIFELMPYSEIFEKAGLAQRDINGDAYILGSKQNFEWISSHKRSGLRGAISRCKSTETDEDNAAVANAGKRWQTLASSSSSLKKKNILCLKAPHNEQTEEAGEEREPQTEQTWEPDLEALYKLYPKRKGSPGKKKGMLACVRLIKSVNRYQEVERAIKNYAALMSSTKKTGTEFVKQFSSFMSCWEDYLDIDSKKENNNINLEDLHYDKQSPRS